MKIEEVKGDLFTSKQSLAHCVSADFHMGRGIAVIFKKQFGRVEELKGKVGECAFLDDGDRYIYYLVTKEYYYHRPTYGDLNASLIALRKQMKKHNVTTLSIPRIASGLDRLSWPRVKHMIAEVFNETDVSITIYTQ